MKTKKRFFLATMLLVFFGVKAQITVSGKVTDATLGNPILGANIVVKGTTIGTSTDFDGNYSINAENGQTLVFSYIGFVSQEVVISGENIDVVLQEDTSKLDEVVVIGYGTTTIRDATGAIEKVDSDDFNKGAITSPDQLIAGKTAGVSVIPASGLPGQGGTIRVRGGNSSLSANNAPLIVIDGVPIDQASAGAANPVSPLSTINPNDIASFVVLKDASSTAIYGSRASAGVILITTKSGTAGSPLRVSLNTTGSIGVVNRTTEVLSAEEYIEVATNSSRANLVLPLIGNTNTDWQDEIFQKALGTDTNLTLTQGFTNSSFRVSLGYTTQEGLVQTSKFERSSAAINFRQFLFDRSLSIDMNIRGTFQKDDFPNGGALGSATLFDPTQPIFSGSEEFGGFYEWMQNGTLINLAPRNPVGLLRQLTQEQDTERAIGNIKLDYNAPFLNGLNANLNLGFDYSEVAGENITPASSASGFFSQGTFQNYGRIRRSVLADFFLNYNTDIESLNSRIELMAGHTYQEFFRSNFNNVNPTVGVPTNTEFATHNSIESYVARVRYSYASKYLFNFTFRTDGSSRFGGDNRWGEFYSGAFAWNISEENFLKDSKTISNLKLRLGYGQTGQQEIGVDFGYLPVFVNGADNQQYQLGDTFFNTVRPSGFDANIKWEESETYNIGLDYGLFNNKISGSIEYFTRETTDVLNFIPIASGTNLTNQLFTNIGDLENSGFEFSIGATLAQKENFDWNVNFNASYLENKILKLNIVDDPNFVGVPTGGINGGIGNNIQIHRVGFPQSSYLVFKQVYDENGRPIEGVYEDLNNDGVVNNSDMYIKEKPAADYLFGFTSFTRYKNWDLSFTLRGSVGNYAYNNVASSTGNAFGLHSLNSNRNVHVSILDTGFENNQLFSDYYIQDASFLKMDNLSIGYDLSDLLSNGVRLKLQTTIQNVFTITNYDGIDPEIANGIDNNFFPRPRTYLLGINMNF